MATQSYIVLGTYTFLYNPVTQNNPPKKRVSKTATFGNPGGYFTVYQPPSGGTYPLDQTIKLNWPFLEISFFNQLVTLFNQQGTLTYIDAFGTSYTVMFMDITYDSILRGGADVMVNVTVTLNPLSQP